MSEIGLDITQEFPKPLTDVVVRAADVVITMGCGDACPVYPGKRYEDWPVADPSGQPIEAVRLIRRDIYNHVRALLREIVPTGALADLRRPDGSRAVSQVAVITDIHGNLLALEAALAAIHERGIDEIYCGGDLVGYGPHPNEVCALIAGARRSPRSTAITTTRSRVISMTAAAPMSPRTTASWASARSQWTLAHTHQPAKDFMRGLPFDVRFSLRRSGRPSRARISPQGQRVPVRGQAGQAVRAAGGRREGRVSGLWTYPQALDPGATAACMFVNCGSVGKPKDGDPRAAFAILTAGGDSVRGGDRAGCLRRRDGRKRSRGAGLPTEFADKLLLAA